jgi:hypothetical protein
VSSDVFMEAITNDKINTAGYGFSGQARRSLAHGNKSPPVSASSKVVEMETTATEIAAKFNIPEVPTAISRVEIPSGTPLRVGFVGPNKWGTSAGAVQFEILLDDISKDWFRPLRKL